MKFITSYLACWLTLGTTIVHAANPSAPLKIVMLSGSEEYESDKTLAGFKQELEASYPVECRLLKAKGTTDLLGLEALDTCDLAIFFTRRLAIDGDQLERVKRYVASGRPIVGIRTASHGFQKWLEFDKLVLGGNYHNHLGKDKTTTVKRAPETDKSHPILDGVTDFASRGSLYKTSPLAPDCKVLLFGTTPDGTHPVAWTREHQGQRIFYTSLGSQEDFDNASFRRLLVNAIFWAANKPVSHPMASAQPPLRPRADGILRLALRARAEAFKGSGQADEVTLVKDLPAAETAIVVCDMWDPHWCKGASARCDAIAAKMAPVLQAARQKGIQIVHAPSECMAYYANTQQRLRAQLAPAPTEFSPIQPRTISSEPPLPIDDSDGGCDTDDKSYRAWTCQNARLDIAPFDAISDNGDEIHRLFRQLGIKNIIMMGVHTNMCVLNRTFAIRSMTRRGYNCILVRDLTDTMYDPKDKPHVSHDEGTELVVRHIETYWGPSTTSRELLDSLSK